MSIRGRRLVGMAFWCVIAVLVTSAIYSHRWSPEIGNRLNALAAGADSVDLAELSDADWNRACLVGPYENPERIRNEVSRQVPRGAGPAMNEVDHVLLLLQDRSLVAYDRIDMGEFDFDDWPSLCIQRDQARLVRGVDEYQRPVWQLVGPTMTARRDQ